MLKTYELQEMLGDFLHDFKPSEDWDDFLMTEIVSNDIGIIKVNFIEIDRSGKMIDNQFEISIKTKKSV